MFSVGIAFKYRNEKWYSLAVVLAVIPKSSFSICFWKTNLQEVLSKLEPTVEEENHPK